MAIFCYKSIKNTTSSIDFALNLTLIKGFVKRFFNYFHAGSIAATNKLLNVIKIPRNQF